MSVTDWVAWILVIIGGLNWGLVGLFGIDWDLVAKVFNGSDTTGAKIVYILVGLSALWVLISLFSKGGSKEPAV